MPKQYVSDIIGDEYKKWQYGDQVIIATPTGSGKTTFVVSQLLREAMAYGKHVVYYCNRKVLHDQFEVQSKSLIERVFGKDLELAEDAVNYLHIFTYQGAELTRSYPSARYKAAVIPEEVFPLERVPNGPKLQLRNKERTVKRVVYSENIMYHIFDEAHYFLSDALIRHDTNYWCEQTFSHGISVFLTATPKPLFLFLTEHGNLPLSNEFHHTIKAINEKNLAKTKYPEIESEVWSLLNAWNRYDNVGFAMEKPTDLKSAFMRRWRNPLSRYFGFVEQLYGQAPNRPHYYREEPDYSYLDVSYFDGNNTLLEQIRRTGSEKWIIFVDSEADGKELLQSIFDQGLGTAALLSSKRIKTLKSAKAVYEMIVQEQCFPCRILISTSVMDCGCNIIDPEVKHMAISCDNETTFLQMLGRKRVTEGERLQLYIALYPYHKIQTRYNQCMDKLEFMIRMGMKNKVDKTNKKSYLTTSEIRDMIRDICAGHRANLFCGLGELKHVEDGRIRRMLEDSSNLDMFLHGLTYSKTAILLMLNRLYDYQLAMDQYRHEVGLGAKLSDFIYNFYMESVDCNVPLKQFVFEYQVYRNQLTPWNEFKVWWDKIKATEPKDGVLRFDLKVELDNFFYLKHQLRWIGKDYDPSCWLLGSEKRLKLINFLEEAVESEPLRQDDIHTEQSNFSLQCIKLMLDLPLTPRGLWRKKSQYLKDKPPGRNLLNKWLAELKLPYEISYDQYKYEGVKKKKTRWIVQRKETGESPVEANDGSEEE